MNQGELFHCDPPMGGSCPKSVREEVATSEAQGKGIRKAETSQQNSVGKLEFHPGNIGQTPGASFASSTVMAARSVNIRC
jgi:hypothetical protein